MMRYFLGIDAGGTKTATTILTEAGVEVGRGIGGPGNVATNDEATLRSSLREAVQEASVAAGLPNSGVTFAGICAGVAGYSAKARREVFASLLRSEVNSDRYRIEPDYVIAFWGASVGEPGVVVIAGTGAVCYGRNAQGATHKEDGLGYLLGDRGSGFWIGRNALRATVMDLLRGGKDSSKAVREAVLAHIGAQTVEEVVAWLYMDFSPAKVAGLVPVIARLAAEEDELAKVLLAEAVQPLRSSVSKTMKTLELPFDTPVYTLGGLWQTGDFFREQFALPRWRGEKTDFNGHYRVGLAKVRLNLCEPHHEAAYGAALLAKEQAG